MPAARSRWFYTVLLMMAVSVVGFAEEKSAWEFSIRAKGVHSSGISDANTYYKAFAGAGYDFNFLMISTEISRYFNYQTTDGLGSYDNINYNEAMLSADLTPLEWFSLNIEGRYSIGDSEYSGTGYAAGLILDFDIISLLADAALAEYEYDFDGNMINFNNQDYSFEIDFSVSESLSFDAGILYNNVIFEEDYEYSKYTGRIGTMFETFENLFFTAGGSAGKDSEDYNIWGFDAGFSWRIFDCIKLMALYSYQYYAVPDSYSSGQTDTTVTKANGPGGPDSSDDTDSSGSYPGNGGSINNPFLSSSKVGESYSSQTVSVSVSCVF